MNDSTWPDSQPWRADANCVGLALAMFPEQGNGSTEQVLTEFKRARRVCDNCTVQIECLRFALENDEQYGMWGGTTPRQRRALKRLAS